jgi:hypothetical protein
MLQAALVAERVRSWLDVLGPAGHVHSVFRRVCNLSWGEWLITLHMVETGALPNGLMLRDDVDFLEMGLRPGQPVGWRPDEACLYVGGHPVSLLGAAPAPAGGRMVAKLADLEANRALLWDLVRRDGRGTIWAQLSRAGDGSARDLAGKSAWERGRRLCESLRRGDEAAVRSGVASLLGLGEGLTPAGDDLILGIMAVLYYSGRGLGVLGDCVALPAREVTTQVSANYLRLAALGEFSSRLGGAATALLGGSDEELWEPVLRLLDHGHSSGTDTAAGLYLGMSVLFAGGVVA